jgi:hypothetical protein
LRKKDVVFRGSFPLLLIRVFGQGQKAAFFTPYRWQNEDVLFHGLSYRYLGTTRIGAAMMSLLFTLGKFLLGLYLGYSGVTSAYGAAGSLVVVLLWVYYLALIFFFGAEFTQVYASVYGAGVEPDDNAQPLSTGLIPS